MPFGAMRHGFTYQPPAAGGTTYDAKNSLTGIVADADNAFRHYAAHYLGDNASGDPCFAWVYEDTGDSNKAKVVAFSVDQTDGSLTIGTPSATPTSDNSNFSLAITTRNTGPNIRSTSSWVAEGIMGFYSPAAGNLKIAGFSVNLSTLAVTISSVAAPLNATGAGVVAVSYVDNDRYFVGHRSTSSQQRSHELWTWDGATLSSVASVLNSDVNDGGADYDAIGFANNGNQYRGMIVGYANNRAGSNHSTVKFDSTTGRYDSETASGTSFIDGTTYTGCDAWIINLDNSSKAVHFQPSTGRGSAKAVAFDVTWGNSTTAPSHSFGSTLTLTGSDMSPIGFGPGLSDNETFYFYDDSGTLSYRPVTASGTTLSEGSATTTSLSVSNNIGTTKWEVAKSGSGDYLVGVIDNTGSTAPDVFVLKVA